MTRFPISASWVCRRLFNIHARNLYKLTVLVCVSLKKVVFIKDVRSICYYHVLLSSLRCPQACLINHKPHAGTLTSHNLVA